MTGTRSLLATTATTTKNNKNNKYPVPAHLPTTRLQVQQLAELEEIVRFRRKEGELRRLHSPAIATTHTEEVHRGGPRGG